MTKFNSTYGLWKMNIKSVDNLCICFVVQFDRWMPIFTPGENILLANHKAHRVLVKLHVFQISRDHSLLVKIGQQWLAM